MMLAGWLNRHQQDVIEYLKEEHLEVCLEDISASSWLQPAEDGGVTVAFGKPLLGTSTDCVAVVPRGTVCDYLMNECAYRLGVPVASFDVL